MIDDFTDHEETMPEGEETVATGGAGETESESVQEDLAAGGADDAIEDSADSAESAEVEDSTPAAVMSGIIKPEESDDDEMAHEWYVVV